MTMPQPDEFGLTKSRGTLLSQRVAVVTGAGRGIGEAIALGLARNGANLVLASRTLSELKQVAEEGKGLGSHMLVQECDVSSEAEVQMLMKRAIEAYGRLDVLVNNAGALGPIGPLEGNDTSKWMDAVKVNLLGVFLCCKYAIPHMKRQNWGRIINLSGAGAPVPYPWFSAYSASKTAILGLTQTLAEEVREYGIQVNAIAPGLTNTRLQDEIISAGELAGASYQRAKDAKDKGGADPKNVADLATFLSSDAAKGITGRFFSSRWDDWQMLGDASKLNEFIGSDMYTIRRIDGVFFGPLRGAHKK